MPEKQSSKLESLRHLVGPGRIGKLARRFREIGPSLVVAVQGNIEHSPLALPAARRAGIPSASYLPVPYANAETGERFGSIRDLFCLRLINLPDTYMTISDEMARVFKDHGSAAPVEIVFNGIDTDRFQPGDSAAASRQLGLPWGKVLIGMLGRIEFRQKQQHLLVEAVEAARTLAASCHPVFAGEGPDADAFVGIPRKSGGSGTVLPWSDPADLYRAMDVMVIPSRHEGPPLVKLDPAKPKAFMPWSAYLSADEAGKLAAWLRLGVELAKTEVINDHPAMGKWTVRFEKEHGVILTNDRGQDDSGDFVLSIPAAKKLAGAVEHALAKAGGDAVIESRRMRATG